MKVWRRNWSSAARRYADADAIIVSLGKSGRTWLRVFLYAYFCKAANREFTLKAEELAGSGAPRLIFTHDLWAYRTAPKLESRLRGRHLVPPGESRDKPILLLVRDPRDVLVSLYFQVTRRSGRFAGDLSEMIRHPRYGVESMVDVMNSWVAEWGERNAFMLLRYEDCRKNTDAAFRRVLAFLGVEPIDPRAFAHALDFSSFDNMKKLEAARQFDARAGILTPGNTADPESFKTRRGIVGGFKDYLQEEDLGYIERVMTQLDTRYGYAIEARST
jgi:hypothetical protein